MIQIINDKMNKCLLCKTWYSNNNPSDVYKCPICYNDRETAFKIRRKEI